MITKPEFSIIKRFSLRNILLICILLLGLSVLNFFRFKFAAHYFLDTSVWFPFSLGIILIFMVLTKLSYNLEKIGITFYGITLILESLSHLSGQRHLLFISIILQLPAIYSFFLFKIKREQ